MMSLDCNMDSSSTPDHYKKVFPSNWVAATHFDESHNADTEMSDAISSQTLRDRWSASKAVFPSPKSYPGIPPKSKSPIQDVIKTPQGSEDNTSVLTPCSMPSSRLSKYSFRSKFKNLLGSRNKDKLQSNSLNTSSQGSLQVGKDSKKPRLGHQTPLSKHCAPQIPPLHQSYRGQQQPILRKRALIKAIRPINQLRIEQHSAGHQPQAR
ncbi:hypothetical protein ABVK25_011192 [Lepraria finkii]|uniref:Uncharacterized protein n=1 Tax=Lepraria finkii TaxID=1340010 RepID=A0ABR4AQC6_9LECA